VRPLEVAILGAGSRGFSAYGEFALRHPHLMKCVAVAEPEDAKRARFGDAHGIPHSLRFRTWQELVAARPPATVIFNCLQDALHAESAIAVMRAGYHQLLEKPMATTPHDCVRVVRAARATGRILAICHVLRYAPFFQTLKEILTARVVGDVVTVVHIENVAFWHQAHSFVRGRWRRRDESSPMILAKSCHDLDLLVYLIGRRPLRLSSFGALTWFRRENAPKGAAERCLDGCPVEPICPYSVQKNYLGGDRPGWIKDSDHVTIDKTLEGKLAALRAGPFGRCVWKCDNDVVDHQVVNIEFEGGTTAMFLMHAFAAENTRTMRYGCTRGEIKGHAGRNELRVTHFADGREDVIHPGQIAGGHGGGDVAMVRQFVEAITTGDPARMLTNVEVSLESHLLAFAAEESRLNHGRVVDMNAYRQRIEEEVARDER